MEKVIFSGEYIKLSALLKLSGLCETGGQAKIAVEDGEVKLNGEVCTRRGKKIYSGDEVSAFGRKITAESEK